MKTENISVQRTGIWLSTSGMLGASPSGIVDDAQIIEVKCPFSARQTPLRELTLQPRDFSFASPGDVKIQNS